MIKSRLTMVNSSGNCFFSSNDILQQVGRRGVDPAIGHFSCLQLTKVVK